MLAGFVGNQNSTCSFWTSLSPVGSYTPWPCASQCAPSAGAGNAMRELHHPQELSSLSVFQLYEGTLMAGGGRAWWPNHCNRVCFPPLEELQAEMNGFIPQRNAGKELERSCVFYNTNSQRFRKKGKRSAQVPDPGDCRQHCLSCGAQEIPQTAQETSLASTRELSSASPPLSLIFHLPV